MDGSLSALLNTVEAQIRELIAENLWLTGSHTIMRWTADPFTHSPRRGTSALHTQLHQKKNCCLQAKREILPLYLIYFSDSLFSSLSCPFISIPKYFMNKHKQKKTTSDGRWMPCCSVSLSYLLCADKRLPTQTRNDFTRTCLWKSWLWAKCSIRLASPKWRADSGSYNFNCDLGMEVIAALSPLHLPLHPFSNPDQSL